MRIVVIGAGPGGLTLAHGLRGAGIDVVVYERDGAAGRRQGISLHMDDLGMTALRACLPPAQVAMLEATMGGPRSHTLALSEVDGAFVARPSGVRPGRQTHRPLLRAVLLTGLEDVVRFGAEFTRFEQRADGRVRVFFADGRTDIADVLVGADGIGSVVRRQYLPAARVVDTGRRMIMGATPLRAVVDTGLPDLTGDNPASTHGCGPTMAMGVLRFTERPVIADIEDYMMWALPVSKDQLGSGTVSLFTAVGGWRTVAEGVASRALFFVAYLFTAQVLTAALIAVGGVFVYAVVRWCTAGKSWQPAIALLVVGVSALLAGSTGQAVNFYFSAVVIQAAGGVVFLLSILVRWPVVGVVVSTARGDRRWRRDRRCYACTAVFLAKFAIATAVLVPLYLAETVVPLGVAATILGGAPAAGACIYLCWRILRDRIEAIVQS